MGTLDGHLATCRRRHARVPARRFIALDGHADRHLDGVRRDVHAVTAATRGENATIKPVTVELGRPLLNADVRRAE